MNGLFFVCGGNAFCVYCADNMADSEMDDLTEKIQNVMLNNCLDGEEEMTDGDNEEMEMPSVLIATNVHLSVFEDPIQKEEFEEVFRRFDSRCTFQYLKSFCRARIIFPDFGTAAKARIRLHATELCGSTIKCYFAQPVEMPKDNAGHLLPPAPIKQFLISPPSSPPVGWEPVHEAEPVINYDLLSAIANLAPGESHELHPASESQPGIVVHICEDVQGFDNLPKIPKTQCPERAT